MAGALERELKVEVDSSFHVPDLSALIGVSVVSLPEVTLSATYYDTPAHDLARWGATLRHRISSSGSQTWTLKLPAPAPAGGNREVSGALERDEIDFDGPAESVPADAVAPLRTYVRDAALGPVAVLETRRRRNLVMSATDTLAEMDDDVVDYRVPDGRTGSFRELEIELSATGPLGILRRIHDVLVGAGVSDSEPQPKLFRALGGVPEPVVGPVPEQWPGSATNADLASWVISAGATALLRDDPRVRLGDDPGALRRFGAALERLTVQLDDLRRLLDPDWHEEVEAASERLAAHLAALESLDTIVGRLAAGASRLPPEDQSAASELEEMLASRRKSHQAPLAEEMDSAGYLGLVDLLVSGAREAPVRRGRTRPARATVERVLQGRLDRLEALASDAAALGRHPSLRAREGHAETADLAALARATRTALHTAVLAAPAGGRPGRRLRSALADMDAWLDELGAATACGQWLRECGPQLEGRLALAAGQLLAGETRRANRARRRWDDSWKTVRHRARKWPTK